MVSKKISQNTIIIMCWLIYSMAYLGRYSYNSNITLIIDSYGVTKAQAGLVATFFFFAYGIGQIVNGILCSRYNKRLIFPIALTISSVINLVVFFGVPFSFIKYFWFINGLAQSCLWSGVISVISKTVDDAHMKWAMLIMSTTTSIGTAVTYSASSLFAFMNNYRLTFLVGAVVMSTIGIIWFCIYNPELEIFESNKGKVEEKTGSKKSKGVIVLLIILGFVSVIHSILKDGLTTWMPEILKDRYNTSDGMSIMLTIALPLLSVFGSIIAIKISEYINNFVLLILLFLTIGALAIGIIDFVPSINVVMMTIYFAIVVCMMHGINNVVNTLAPIKLRGAIDSGKIAGIMNGCCYVGSTISTYALGRLADIGGWQMVLNMMFAISVSTIIVCMFFAKRRY